MSGTGVAGTGRSSELRLRILSSIVLGALVLGSTWAGGHFVAIVWLVASGAVAIEWMQMAGIGRAPVLSALMIGGLVGGIGIPEKNLLNNLKVS